MSTRLRATRPRRRPPRLRPPPRRPPQRRPPRWPASWHVTPRGGWLIAAGVLAVVAVIIIVAVSTHSGGSPQASGQSSPAGIQPSPPDTGAVPDNPPPPTSTGIVQFSPDVQADPRAAAVGDMLNTYFSGINTGDYQGALSVEDPAGSLNPGNASEVQRFAQGVQTTQDDRIVLVSLGPADTTSPATSAAVTFQSTQQQGYGPADNPNQTCTNWSLTYVLTPEPDGSYLIYNVKSASDQGC